MIILENQICDAESRRPISIEDYVIQQRNRPSIGLALELLPYSNFLVRVSSGAGETMSYIVILTSSGLEAELPESLSLDSDHLVCEDYVFPFERSAHQELRSLLTGAGISLSGTIDADSLRTIIRAKVQVGVDIELPEDFESLAAEQAEIPVSLLVKSQLWDYQLDGYRWLAWMWLRGMGAILADEMGVGKTLQLIALVALIHEQKAGARPVLIVVPNNLMLTWAREFVTHAPNVADLVHLHWGSQRSKDLRFLENQDVILTPYSLLAEDIELFGLIDLEAVILDEAHWAKNPISLRTDAVKQLRSSNFYLSTGTPVKNRLIDLWNLVDIIDRGLLGRHQDYQAICKNSPEDAVVLGQLVSNRILRRTQEMVGIALPETIEIDVPLTLDTSESAELKRIKAESASEGAGRGSIWPERQFCAHTGSRFGEKNPGRGQKAAYLLDEMTKITESAEKAIAFISDCNEGRGLYTKLIMENFPQIYCRQIDGQTPQDLRYGYLEEFKKVDGTAILFLNPAVSGTGETIVEANHVFHLNPGWTAADADQATFRVVRPGQTRKTVVRHIYYVDTIEEAAMQLIASKREISEIALRAAEDKLSVKGLLARFG